MSLFLQALAFTGGVLGAVHHIESVNELIEFSNNVNKGNNYKGTTVFLESDLSFAGETFEPIGTSYYFSGIFDGQGHVISNLAMNSSLRYAGVFGYSTNLGIKNVILDSSCSITSSYIGSSHAYIGGIIGECYAHDGDCAIENSVNMGSVTFSGDISGDYLYLGGISGYLYSSSKFESTVKNCANYGDVTHSGESYYSYIGGIAGYSEGSSDKRVYIYNSLNHGTITHNGTTSSRLYLGGIVGYTKYTTIENCVSGGRISSEKSGSIGSIVGYVISGTSINYCYLTSYLSAYEKYDDWNSYPTESNTLSYDSTIFELSGTVSIGSYNGNSLIDALNTYSDYYTLRDYSHWLLNKNNNHVSFTINKRSPFTLNSQIILLPSLAREGNVSFDGWYTDGGLTKPLAESVVTESMNFYGRFEEDINYTITFDTRRGGVFVAPIVTQFGSAVTLPSNSIREHCVVAWWETIIDYKIEFNFIMPAHNITLYGVWKCTRIETPDDLIDFSKVVNNGINYTGMTVFLDSDIDLTGKIFEPIGTSESNYFSGVFDGQGHVVSNLAMNSTSQYVGLFGYSRGLTIKNVIIDSSCSITSSYIGSSHAYVGGIIGYCVVSSGKCIIENNVNMGSATFSGSLSGNRYSLYLGGIAGYIESSDYITTVKNCANYCGVTRSGTSYYSYIGGIVGYSEGYSSTKNAYIYNSLNHGTITHSGTTSSRLYLGGISGYAYRTTIENCVSGGKISSTKTSYIGSIVGNVDYDTSINYCYYTRDLSYGNYGKKDSTPTESNIFSYDSTIFELSGTVSIGSYTSSSLTEALNAYSDYYILRDYSHWLLNKNNKHVTFTINKRSSFASNSQIILLPSLAREGNMTFDGWYTDGELT